MNSNICRIEACANVIFYIYLGYFLLASLPQAPAVAPKLNRIPGTVPLIPNLRSFFAASPHRAFFINS